MSLSPFGWGSVGASSPRKSLFANRVPLRATTHERPRGRSYIGNSLKSGRGGGLPTFVCAAVRSGERGEQWLEIGRTYMMSESYTLFYRIYLTGCQLPGRSGVFKNGTGNNAFPDGPLSEKQSVRCHTFEPPTTALFEHPIQLSTIQGQTERITFHNDQDAGLYESEG
jgi:hypothetical protein